MKTHLTILFLAFSTIGFSQMNTHFVTTWDTNIFGSSGLNSIEIPLHPTTPYNFDVDWNNDGVFDELGITGYVVHHYSTPGVYTIRIRGDFPRVYFYNDPDYISDGIKLLNVDQWGTQIWTSFEGAFYGCMNYNGTASDNPNLTNITNMHNMFNHASNFNGDISSWDVTNVTDMSGMFTNSYAFNQNIGSWDVGNVTNMSSMFESAYIFNQDIGNWNVGSVTNMSLMFRSAHDFNQDIGNWNVENVTNMEEMFYATPFNQDIGDWDVGSVTNMSYMFFSAGFFNQDIGNWNVGNVTSMWNMFYHANSFNQDIGNWDVSNVLYLAGMFGFAEQFDQDLGSWNVENVVNFSNLFIGSKLSTSNYDSLLIGWNAQNLQPNLNFHGGYSQYCYGASARENMISSDNWTIYDEGVELGCNIGIDEEIDRNVSIYPNPSKGLFNLVLDNTLNSKLFITDIFGNIIASENNFTKEDGIYSLDLSSFKNGIYLIEYISEDARITKKLILIN